MARRLALAGSKIRDAGISYRALPADLLRRMNQHKPAAAAYEGAGDLCQNTAERMYPQRRLDEMLRGERIGFWFFIVSVRNCHPTENAQELILHRVCETDLYIGLPQLISDEFCKFPKHSRGCRERDNQYCEDHSIMPRGKFLLFQIRQDLSRGIPNGKPAYIVKRNIHIWEDCVEI